MRHRLPSVKVHKPPCCFLAIYIALVRQRETDDRQDGARWTVHCASIIDLFSAGEQRLPGLEQVMSTLKNRVAPPTVSRHVLARIIDRFSQLPIVQNMRWFSEGPRARLSIGTKWIHLPP